MAGEQSAFLSKVLGDAALLLVGGPERLRDGLHWVRAVVLQLAPPREILGHLLLLLGFVVGLESRVQLQLDLLVLPVDWVMASAELLLALLGQLLLLDLLVLIIQVVVEERLVLLLILWVILVVQVFV